MRSDLTHTAAWLRSGPSPEPFDRIAEAVMGAVAEIGGPDSTLIKIAVLERCLAMSIAGFTDGEPDAAVRERCEDVAIVLHDHVRAFRKAMRRDLKALAHA